MTNRQQLEQAITVQESLRGTIDEAIVDATIAALRAQLAALDSAPDGGSRRAQATILFIDLAGHTDLIQGRDPEEIMEIIDRALERLALPVMRHGGRIVRYQGDGYKAVFGLPAAQENDPDNAVLAGLDVLREAEAIAAELAAERAMPGFQVRAGIDTGLVLIGGGTEGQDAVTGLPVNLAARLESLAEPGTLLISHHTYQHVRGVFDFQPMSPVVARGFAHPVSVYRVLRRKPRSFRTRRRGVEGVETRMIGRSDELASLQALYRRMIDERACVAAVVVGDAGLGKSRLLYEFENWADLQPEDAHLYRGRARLETQGLPYGLLRDVFAFRFGILDDDSLAVVRQKFTDGFRDGSDDADSELKAHVVGQMLGYDFTNSPHVQPLLNDARQLRTQAIFYLTEYVRATAARLPILFLLEDLHWADDSSLDTIAALAGALVGYPVMFLGAARPPLYERRPGWLADHPGHERIDLVLLDAADSRRLVAEILQRADAVPPDLQALIVQRAEGNPFYVEELIKMLIDDGVIVKGEERWRVADDKLAGLQVPPTLTGVLQARLEALPAAERDALQVASVIGRHFWDAAVDYVCRQESGRVDLGLWLALRRREVVYLLEGSTFEGATEYVFKHALLRDVVYESVLRRLRRDYHRHAAEWLIRAGGDRVDEHADQIAAHFAAAGATREEAEWQARAGRLAARQYAVPEAIRALDRALELLPPEAAAVRFELLTQRLKMVHIMGERDQEAADLDRLQQLAEVMDDARCQAQVAVDRMRFHLVTGAYEEALALGDRAQALADAAADTSLQAIALGNRGNALMLLGRYSEARPAIERAIKLARAADSRHAITNFTRILGILAEELGDFETERRAYEESLIMAREMGDRISERRALNSLGVAALNEGNYGRARDFHEQSLAIARAIGDRVGEGTVLGNLGVGATMLGEYEEARQLFERSRRLAVEANDRTGITINTPNLANILTHLGQTDAALSYYDEARRGVEETGDRPLLGYILNGKGRALLQGGRLAEAEETLRRAYELRRELGQHHTAAESQAFLGEALAATGQPAAAVGEAEAVLAFLQDGQLESAEDELRVFLSLYRVLHAAGDERAMAVLRQAHARLLDTAAALDETSRHAYLSNVPWNREIITLWEETGRPGDRESWELTH